MSDPACRGLDAFLDRRMAPEEARRFEAHARQCPRCAPVTSRWQRIEGDMRAWAQERIAAPDASDRAGLLRKARAPQRAGRPWLPLGVVGVLAAAAAVVVLVLARMPPPALPVLVATPEGEQELFPAGKPARIEAKDRSVLARVAKDRIAVRRGGSVRFKHADARRLVLLLERGELGVDAAKGEARKLVVETGVLRVDVMGTRFLVAAGDGGGRVSVAQGRVQVTTADGHTEVVEAGHELRVDRDGSAHRGLSERDRLTAIDALLRGEAIADMELADVAPADEEVESAPALGKGDVASLGELRRMVVAGRLDEAESRLRQHLRQRPNSAAAWSLLGDVLRKSNRPDEAVTAYRRVIDQGRSGQAQRARYIAAATLQDDLNRTAEAAILLGELIDKGGIPEALAAAAKVRLARARIALGEVRSGRRLLDEVILDHPEAPAADEARRLLRQ